MIQYGLQASALGYYYKHSSQATEIYRRRQKRDRMHEKNVDVFEKDHALYSTTPAAGKHAPLQVLQLNIVVHISYDEPNLHFPVLVLFAKIELS